MLLDTCGLLWLVEGGGRLSAAARERLENAPVLYISAISAFEIGLKCSSGKLRLPVLPAEWFETVVDHHGLEIVSLDWQVCLAAAELPPIHRDPCDRFVIATARVLRIPALTGDPVFGDYGIEIVC